MSEELVIDLEAIFAQSQAQGCDWHELLFEHVNQYSFDVQLEVFDEVAYQFYQSDALNEAIILWSKAADIALAHHLPDKAAQFFCDAGTCLNDLSQFDQAIEVLDQAQQLPEAPNSALMIAIYLGLSVAHRGCTHHQQALDCANNALKLAEQQQDPYEICRASINLGHYYADQLNYHQAEQCYLKAQQIAVSLTEQSQQTNGLLATIVMNLGLCCKNQLDYQQALNHYLAAETIFIEQQDPTLYSLYMNLGALHSTMGNLSEAEQYLTAALDYYRDIENHTLVADCLTNIGRVKEQIEMPSAVDYFLQALAIYEQSSTPNPSQSSCLLNLANAYMQQGQASLAFTYYKRCMYSGKLFSQQDMLACAAKGLADIFHHQGKFSLAISRFEQSLTLAKTYNDPKLIIAIYANWGALLTEVGEFTQALNLYQQALSDAKCCDLTYDVTKLITSVQINLSSLYTSMGERQLAEQSLLTALETAGQANDENLKAKALSNLANLYESSDQFDIAIEYCQQAISVKKQLHNPKALAFSYGTLARLYEQAEQNLLAQRYYQQCLELLQTHGDDKTAHMAKVNYGLFLQHTGAVEKAQILMQQALDYFIVHPMHESFSADHANLGSLYQDKSTSTDNVLAIYHYQQAIDLYAKANIPLDDEQWRIYYRHDIAYVYNALIELLLGEQQTEQALDVMRQAKSNTFMAVLTDKNKSPSHE